MAKKTKIDSLSPNAFDSQLLLLDMFLGNVSLGGSNKLVSRPAMAVANQDKHVPYFSVQQAKYINQFLPIISGQSGAQRFIQEVTPYEYAQMYPAIKLSLIKIDDPTYNFALPLSEPGKINQGYNTNISAGYYSTNTFGLTSMNLTLDGNDNPFFGKSYIVDFEFVFDSINTYVGPIKGLTEQLSYANIFRSSGRVADTQFGLKLDIGYTSNNNDIVEKYSLHTEMMNFSMYLSFLKSSVKIKENLQVVIKAEYQSREQKIFDSTQLFDILGLDLQARREEYENRIEVNDLKRQALDAGVSKAEAQIRAQISGDIEAIQAKTVSLQQSLNNLEAAEASRATTGARGGGYGGSRNENSAIISYREQISKNSAKIKQLEARKLLERDALLKEYGVSDPFKDLNKALDDDIKKAQKKLRKIRHNQIIEAINDLLNGKLAAKVKKSVTVKSKDLKKYYGDSAHRPGATGLKIRRKNKDLMNASQANETSISTINAQVQSETPSPKADASQQASEPEWWESITGGSSGESEEQKQNQAFQNKIDELAISLSKEKAIEYILLGDLMRLIFARLKKNTQIKAKNINKSKSGTGANNTIQNIKQNLEKSVVILPTLEITNLEKKGTLEEKSLYDLPISVAHLHYILARELYGKTKNTFTMFNLMDEIAKLISLTRKRKEQVLDRENSEEAFTLKEMTYPMLRGTTGGGLRIMTHRGATPPAGTEYVYGIVMNVRKSRQAAAKSSNTPQFIFGGHDRGIIKTFDLVEYDDDDLQKLVLEEVSGNSNDIIPSMFSVSMKTLMCPIFQLGMIINIEAPTITTESIENGIFVKGQYHINKITHEYSFNSGFTSSISAFMFSDQIQTVAAAVDKEAQLSEKINTAAEQLAGVLSDLASKNKTGPSDALERAAPEIIALDAKADVEDILINTFEPIQ